jgi:multisubunit Na+/H+ antiporter MnhB subunit
MNIDLNMMLQAGGVTGGVVITAAFILGFFRVNIKDRVKWHRRLGIAAFVIAIMHASLFAYIKYFK